MFQNKIKAIKIFLPIPTMSNSIQFHGSNIFYRSEPKALSANDRFDQFICMGDKINLNVVYKSF